MKIAIVHDQLLEFGGAERVLVTLKKIFPNAPVYTSFYSPNKLGSHANLIKGWDIKTSWAQKVPFLKNLYSPLRFITPRIWESFDLSGYDIVISSSGSYMCKGIVTKPGTTHICYLHHPPRYLYYYETAREWQKYALIRAYGNLINHDLRIWDYLSSQRVDHFIANSEETRRRIQKFYRKDATVIYPHVFIPDKLKTDNYYQITENRKPITEYYLTISRLARAKHIDILIKAANELKFSLKIVGIGRDEAYLKQIAGPTVEFLGNVADDKLPEIYKNAKAFLFAANDEEFGIAPVEAMGYGLPVIAYRSGGVPETVKEGHNGLLFDELSAKSLIEKIKQFEQLSEYKRKEFSHNARKTSEFFSEANFKAKILEFVEKQNNI